MNTTDTATPILRRKCVPWPERTTSHIPAAYWRRMPLADLLAGAAGHVRTLHLIAGPYADQRPLREWWLAPASAGWAIANYAGDPPRATYRRDGHAVDVVTTAPWFGECTEPATIERAWRMLGMLCRGTFDRGATLMATPARTGLDLLQRSLPANGEYPVAPDEELRLLLANSGQGRMEFLPTTADTSDLTWLDARWQYAACVTNLPRGRMHHDRSHEVIEHAPAFYFGRWRAPAGWPYPFGLLPELNPDEDSGQRFVYPLDARWHTGWLTGVELDLAYRESWDLRVSERIWWDMVGPDPARTWATKLRTMRQHVESETVQGAIRHLLIDTVGAWHRQARRELHITPREQAETIPADAYRLVLIDDAVEWLADAPIPTALQPMQHPEWAWTVWGRSRVRLLKAALCYLHDCPGGEIVALRSDALVVTRDPGWCDDGAVGTFRRKRRMTGVAVPHDETAYRELLPEEE
ncbi:MAG TPA: hypothetical protein VKQ30_03150 [Ktedonobacterales bacterium]|nr:hypothetical protein [Ktedonobacterales bacterium]